MKLGYVIKYFIKGKVFGGGNMTDAGFLVTFFIIIFLVIIFAVIAVIGAVTGSIAGIVDDEDEMEEEGL